MSDLKKIEAATGKLQKLLDWAKQNTMLAGIVITVLPAIASGGYITITKANEIIGMYNDFSDVASDAASAKRKVVALEEKVAEMRETITKLQERSSDALVNAREAKIVSESVQKELRAGLAAQKVELEVTTSSLRSEMNSLKRATTNRLGQ
jgi:Fe-S cluster assembly scaffold protein SufB